MCIYISVYIYIYIYIYISVCIMRVMMYVYFSGRQEAKGMKANGAMSGRHDGETPASNVFFFFLDFLLLCKTFGHN